MKIEASQLSYATHSQIGKTLVFIERCVAAGDKTTALYELAKLREKIAAIRAVSSRLIEEEKK